MEPSQWLASFRVIHEQARRGTLNESENKKYLAMRDELARSLMQAEGVVVPEGVPPRRAFKMAQMFQVELSGVYRTMTREISCAGFVAVVGGSFKESDRLTFSLTLSRATEPLSGFALVKTVVRQSASAAKITCSFDDLGEERTSRLELALFDAALARFAT